MEKLDIIFASRYLDAYFDHQKKKPITKSWQRTFDISKYFWPIVLQHLLLGMNAHINLDLGIAAAEVSRGKNIGDLQGDFNKINDILSSLVDEVQNQLANIWPRLKIILTFTRKVDNFLVDFSMKKARDGAWKFAESIAHLPEEVLKNHITKRDQKVARNVNIIIHPGWIVRIIFGIIRLGERGTVAEKIESMRKMQ
jgi:hypothetical protein